MWEPTTPSATQTQHCFTNAAGAASTSEPNLEAIKLFNRARPRDINLGLGVGSTHGTLTYYRFADPAYNTFSPEAAEALQPKHWLTALPSAQVEVWPLRDILAEHLPPNTSIIF